MCTKHFVLHIEQLSSRLKIIIKQFFTYIDIHWDIQDSCRIWNNFSYTGPIPSPPACITGPTKGLSQISKCPLRSRTSKVKGGSINKQLGKEENHVHIVCRSADPWQTAFSIVPGDTSAKERWTFQLGAFTLSPSAMMHPPKATDKTLWMNEQVTFLICHNKQYRCLERGQQDQGKPSVNRKGNMPLDAQLETEVWQLGNRIKYQRCLCGSCCGHFSAIRQLQLSQPWGPVPVSWLARKRSPELLFFSFSLRFGREENLKGVTEFSAKKDGVW